MNVTSLEQSKQLIGWNFDFDSADACWWRVYEDEPFRLDARPYKERMERKYSIYEEIVPAWSAEGLANAMSSCLVSLYKSGDGNCYFCVVDKAISGWKDNALDAVFDAIKKFYDYEK